MTNTPYYKMYRSGDVIEVYKYDKSPPDNTEPIEWGDDDNFPFHDIYEKQRNPFGKDKEWVKDDGRTKKDWNYANAVQKRIRVRRLLTENFNENSKFITLTFAENVTDLDKANKEFKKFIQRLRRKYEGFRYLAVIEFQKRGAVHYHMISDLPYIENSELRGIWSNGFVKINNISHVDNVGPYVVKYMTKETDNPLLKNRKTYLTSRGLSQPDEIGGDTAESILEDMDIKKEFPVIGYSYETEYMGTCEYAQYNLKRK